jgi:hypothetical protein
MKATDKLWYKAAKGDLAGVREGLTRKPGQKKIPQKTLDEAMRAAIMMPLVDAAVALQIVELLLQAGANANCCDGNPKERYKAKPPLAHAARRSNSRGMVELLLRHGADPNLLPAGSSHGETPIFHVYDPEVVALLAAAGARLDVLDAKGRSPLMVAIFHRWPETVAALLDAGADIEFEDPQGNPPFAHALVYRGGGRAEEQEASERVRRVLLERGASQNKLGQARLRLAIYDGDASAVRRLIAEGVSVDAGCPAGSPPLVTAAGGGSLEIVRALIDASANVNCRDGSGLTPLMAAARGNLATPGGGYLDIVQALVEAGADVHASENASDSRGVTALWHAREFRNHDVVDYLKKFAKPRKPSRP